MAFHEFTGPLQSCHPERSDSFAQRSGREVEGSLSRLEPQCHVREFSPGIRVATPGPAIPYLPSSDPSTVFVSRQRETNFAQDYGQLRFKSPLPPAFFLAVYPRAI